MDVHRERVGAINAEDKWASILAADRLRDAVENLRREAIRQNRPDLPISQAIKEVMPQISMTTNLVHDDLAWHSALFAREDWGAPTDSLSTLYCEEGYEVYGYGDSVFVDGYGSLIAKLAEGLDIKFEETVASIEFSASSVGKVLVRTQNSDYRAHRVIVTLPLGVLKSGRVQFRPSLSEFKQKAIDRLGVATVGKMFLFFKDVFWDKNQYIFGHITGYTMNQPTHIVNLWKTQGIPCLQIQAGGELGKWLESCSEIEAEEWAKRFLESRFETRIPKPSRIMRSNWSNDEFSLGAYTYMKVGSRPDDSRMLAEPIGDWLYFAGEATNPFQWGSAHGAYISGLREAARITGDASIMPVRLFSESKRQRAMVLRSSRFFNQQMRQMDESTIRKRIQILGNTEIFKTISNNELRLLASMLKEKKYAAGEIICRQGDKADDVFVVQEGRIEVRLGIERRAIESSACVPWWANSACSPMPSATRPWLPRNPPSCFPWITTGLNDSCWRFPKPLSNFSSKPCRSSWPNSSCSSIARRGSRARKQSVSSLYSAANSASLTQSNTVSSRNSARES
jgi:hypothetical protein